MDFDMKLDEIYDMMEKDFNIDHTDLGAESIKTELLWVKYQKLFSQFEMGLEKMENDKRKLIAEKRKYYSGDAPAEVYKAKPFDKKIKSDALLEKYVSDDTEVVDFDQKILITKQKKKVLGECLEACKRRQWIIKTALDYQRFISGSF